MPLGAVYDKMIDSKFADVKNAGGRRRLDHRRAVPAAIRQGDALGASRHRRHGMGAALGHQPVLGLGLGRASARSIGGRLLRRLGSHDELIENRAERGQDADSVHVFARRRLDRVAGAAMGDRRLRRFSNALRAERATCRSSSGALSSCRGRATIRTCSTSRPMWTSTGRCLAAAINSCASRRASPNRPTPARPRISTASRRRP